MIDKLQKWINLLKRDGIGSKQIVLKDMETLLQALKNDERMNVRQTKDNLLTETV